MFLMAQNINKIWLIYYLFLVSVAQNLSGHGVAGETLVSILPSKSNALEFAWMQIDQLQDCIHEKNTLVKTWPEQQLEFRSKAVCATSKGDINCYIELWLVANPYQTLRCAPDQLFYVLPPPIIDHDLIHQSAHGPTYVRYHNLNQAIKAGYWAQACTLQPGQILLRENHDQVGAGIQVTQVDFKAQALKVYNLDVTDDHTYLITRFNIVTHNSELNAMFAQQIVQHSSQIAAATGLLATIGNWLSAAGITTGSTGLFTVGISAPLSAPVLIAVSTVGAGLVAWHVFNFWGRKHVDYRQNFDLSSLQNTRAQLDKLPVSCGLQQAKSVEAGLSTCDAPNLTTQTLLGGKLIGADKPLVTSCPTSLTLLGTWQVLAPDINCLANLPTLVALQNLDLNAIRTENKETGCLKNDFGLDSENLDVTMQESKTDEEIHQEVVQLVDDFLKPIKIEDVKKSKIYVKNGSILELDKDFASFQFAVTEEKETIKGKIKVGHLPNGWKMVARHSEDGRPTLEIQRGHKNKYKVRYEK
jgi:hypothetical protein